MKRKFTLLLCLFHASLLFSSEVTLDQYLQKVVDQNLSLKSEKLKLNSSDANASGVRLPPPIFGVTLGKEEQGNSPTGIEINQEIPFPSKLKSNHSAREFEFKAQRETLTVAQNEIIAKAKLAYINLWLMQETINVINQRKKILLCLIFLAEKNDFKCK
jgi:outer membrane protein TolC